MNSFFAVLAALPLALCENDYNYDRNSVESRVRLTECFVPARAKSYEGLKMCNDYVRTDKSKSVASLTVDGDLAMYQSPQLETGADGLTAWRAYNEQGKTTCLGTSYDRYCRQRAVCKMVEQLWGYLTDAPSVFRESKWLLSRKNVNGYGDLQDRVVEQCINCQFVPCQYWTCPNGRVNGRALETVAGKVIRLPECGVACSAGRFLTCSGAGACGYQVYTQENARQDAERALSGSSRWFGENVNILKVGLNVIDVADARPPVTDCYPCRLANKLNHGGKPYITDDVLFAAGFLSFTCPGGDALPVSCGLNRVSKFDAATETGSACGCMPRYYHNSTLGICAPCPPGFKCAWVGMTPPTPVLCEPDTYSRGGEEACTPCNTNQAACSNGEALTSCRYGAQNSKFQSQDARCVRCEQCTQLGGSTPCYGVTPKVFS